MDTLLINMKAPLLPRLAVFSFRPNNPWPRQILTLIFIWSNFHLFQITLRTTLLTLRKGGAILPWALEVMDKALLFENMEIIQTVSGATSWILGVLSIYFFIFLLIGSYIVIKLDHRKMPRNFLSEIWCFLIKLHHYALFYPIHIICLQILWNLFHSEGTNSFGKGITIFLKVLCFFCLIMNTLFTFVSIILLQINLKRKNFLTGKTNSIQILDISFKLIQPILLRIDSHSHASYIVLICVNILFFISRSLLIFRTLPYYQYEILKFACYFQSIMISFAFASIIAEVFSFSSSFPNYPSLLILLWIIFGVVSHSFYKNYLFKTFTKILLNPTTLQNPYHIIHFWEVYKSFLKNAKLKTHLQGNKTYFYLVLAIRNSKNSKVTSLIPLTAIETDEEINKNFFKIYIDMLKRTIQQKPKIILLKTILAYYSLKSDRTYSLAKEFLDKDLKNSYSCQNSILLIKLILLENFKKKNEINRESEQKSSSLDVRKYINVTEEYNPIKRSIMKELDLRITYWKEFHSKLPDFLSMLTITKKIHSQSNKYKRTFKEFGFFQKARFYKPMLVHGLYFCLVQNNIQKGLDILAQYCLLGSQARGMDEINDEFNMTSSCITFILSTSKTHLGIILDCFGKVKEAFGTPQELLLRTSFKKRMPEVYSKLFDEILKSHQSSETLNLVMDFPLFTKNNHILLYNIHLSLHYIIEHGLCYYVILKPIQNKKVILVTQSGKILHYSKEFGEEMNIPKGKNKCNIFDFCPDLVWVIQEFSKHEIIEYSKELSSPVNSESNPFKRYSKFAPFQTLTTENNHEAYTETSRQAFSHSSKKEIDLIFFPLFKGQPLNSKSSPSSPRLNGKDHIMYKAQIQQRKTIEITIYEISLERMTSTTNVRPQSPVGSKTSFEIIEPSLLLENPLGTVPSLIFKRSMSPKFKSKVIVDSFRNTRVPNTDDLDVPNSKESNTIKVNKIRSSTNLFINTTEQDDNIQTENPLYVQTTTERFEFLSPRKDTINIHSCISESIQIDNKQIMEETITKDFSEIKAKILSKVLGEDSTNDHILYSQTVNIYKAIQSTLKERTYSLRTKLCNILFALVKVWLIVFLVWVNIQTTEASNNLEFSSEAVRSAYFCIFFTKGTAKDLLYWLAVRGAFAPYDISLNLPPLIGSATFLKDANSDLYDVISKIDHEIQKKFYEKDVIVAERTMNFTLEYSDTLQDTFQIINKIVNKAYSVYTPEILTYGEEFMNIDSYFILDNCLNDLLIKLQKLIHIVEDYQRHVIQEARNMMILTFYATLASLVFLMLVYFCLTLLINKEFTKFMKILFTLQPRQITKTEKTLQVFCDLLKNDNQDNDILRGLDLLGSDYKQENKEQNPTMNMIKGERKANQTASMDKLHTRNCLIFVGLLFCLILAVVFMIVYYNIASRNINVMEKQQNTATVTLNHIDLLNSFNLGLQTLTILNGTLNIENIPAAQYLLNAVKNLKNVGNLQDILKDDHGELPKIQHDILYRIDCSDTYTPLTNWTKESLQAGCRYISNGLNYVGLLNLVAQTESIVIDFLQRFNASERAPLDIQGLYQEIWYYMTYIPDTGIILLLQSYGYSTETFQLFVRDLERKRVMLAWVASIFCVVLAGITWVLFIRRLSRVEFEKKEMLEVLPNKFILGNYLLKNYLISLNPNVRKFLK